MPSDRHRRDDTGEISQRLRAIVDAAGRLLKPEHINYTWRASGALMRLVESLLHSHIRVEGVGNVPLHGPVLFVANHFTRFETFIVPYLIYRYTHREVCTLAHHALFTGRFGEFLRHLGAMSTKHPRVKQVIAEDLLTGRHDWLIYPEGSMIKDKQIWSENRFMIHAPDEHKGPRPPHSGAAVMALQAELYLQEIRRAAAHHDTAKLEAYRKRFHYRHEHDLPREPLHIVPINISYWPMRPAKNLLTRLARLAFKSLSGRLEEELEVEGTLLLSETDISVYFGRRTVVRDYLAETLPNVETAPPAAGFAHEHPQVEVVLDMLKNRLTRRMMSDIYTLVTVNIDHLFCGGLRAMRHDRIDRDDFHAAMYLAARELQSVGSRRSHPTIAADLIDIVADEPSRALDDIRRVAVEAGALDLDDRTYVVRHDALARAYTFHDIRIKNPVRVIANELEPLRPAVKALKGAVNQPHARIRAKLAEVVAREDQLEFEKDYAATEGLTGRKPPEIGRPFHLARERAELGVVLTHGYLACPEEIRLVADRLRALGYSVYGVRLKGHGTAPAQLATVGWRDWLRSLNRGYAVLKHTCRRVVLGGFSTGGLLSMVAAAHKGDAVAGVFSINAPLRLVDIKSALVPAVMGWNHLLDYLHVRYGKWDHVANAAENPTINYDQNYLNGVRQLELLMDVARDEIPKVRARTLVVQGDQDPVVHPASGQQIHDLLRCDGREFAPMAFNRHVIVRGEGCEQVIDRVADFVRDIHARVAQHPLPALPGAEMVGRAAIGE